MMPCPAPGIGAGVGFSRAHVNRVGPLGSVGSIVIAPMALVDEGLSEMLVHVGDPCSRLSVLHTPRAGRAGTYRRQRVGGAGVLDGETEMLSR